MARLTRLSPWLATGLVALGPVSHAADTIDADVIRRLEERVRALEEKNAALEHSLASDRISEEEPELVTRLKDIESRALSMQKQARMVDALEGISAGVSVTTAAQHAGGASTDDGTSESQWNYRADAYVSLPGGSIGNADGSIFAHVRIGQGDGLNRIVPMFGGANATGFHVLGGRPDDDATVLLAQAWYQLDVPLPLGGFKPSSRQTLSVNFGKMDPYLFFDQNSIADDETTRFVNAAFVHNPLLDAGGDLGVDGYGFAPGVRIAYRNETMKPTTWGISAGVFGGGAGATFNNSFDNPLFIIQAETSQKLFGGLNGNYRVYFWRNDRAAPYANEFDASTEAHDGIGVSADQRFGDAVTVFVRYGHQFTGRVRFDRALTVGAELGGSYWNRAADAFGVALGALRTSRAFRVDALTLDADGDSVADFGYLPRSSEQIAELYYRFRLNSQFELSPSMQHIHRPAGDDAAKDVNIFGVRALVAF